MTKAKQEAEKTARATKKVGQEAKKAVPFFVKLKNAAKNLSKEIKNSEQAISEVTSALTKMALVGTAALAGAVFVAARFESGMTNVAKTTGLAGEELKVLGNSLDLLGRKIPVSAAGLADIATIAGQLGINSSEDILKFTTTVAELATVSDFTAQAAAESLARLSNVFELPISQVDRMASVINELENNTTATAPRLTNFAQRLAVAANRIGVSAEEALGLSATLIDLGFRAEEAGSAVSRIFLEMSADSERFAKLTGQSLEEFNTKLSKDAIGAFTDVAAAIGELPTREAAAAFEDLGLNGIRLQNVLGALSSRTDLLAKNIRIATDEFKENTSLQKELAVFLKSTENQFKILINTLQSVALVFGNQLLPAIQTMIEVVKFLADAFLELPDFIQTTIVVLTTASVIIVTFAAALGLAVLAVPPLIGAVTTLIPRMVALTASTRSAAFATVTWAKSMGVARTVAISLGTGLKAILTTVFSLTTALVTLGAGFAAFIISTALASKAVNDAADAFEEAAFQSKVFASGKTIRSLETLEKAVKKIGKASQENVQLLDQEIRLRQTQIKLDLTVAKEALRVAEEANTFAASFFSDTEKSVTDAEKVVKSFEDKLLRADKAMAKVAARLEIVNDEAKKAAAQGLKDAKEMAEQLQKAFEDAQVGTDAFFKDLQALNSFKFDTLINDLKSQAALRDSLLKAQGASVGELAQAELQTSKQILALKEQEIAQRLELEERRVARQSQLIADNVSDEADAAIQLQNLAKQALETQIESTQKLIGIRQSTVDAVRKQLAQLASAAISVQKSLEATIRGINARIRTDNQIGFSIAKKFQSDISEIDALNAQIRTDLANGELESAKRAFAERKSLIQKNAKDIKNEAGISLESDNARKARLRTEREGQIELAKLIAKKEEASIAAAQVEGVSFLEKEKQTIEDLKISLKELAEQSKVVNLTTNFVETIENLELVQKSLTKLKKEAGGIRINVTADQSVLDIITGIKPVTIDFSGINELNTLVTAFELKITTALSNAERIARLLNRGVSTAPGFDAGGSVRGPGTGTSDSILARLSTGEFVMREAAVNKFGVGFFDKLNKLRIPRFAEGGAVGAIPVSTTTRDRVSITLNLNKQTFDLESDRDTAQNMVRAFDRLKSGLVGG